ncbi:MAG: hypothetical protein ACW98Y_16100 [Candidatus Thorarchaeota archaeon]
MKDDLKSLLYGKKSKIDGFSIKAEKPKDGKIPIKIEKVDHTTRTALLHVTEPTVECKGTVILTAGGTGANFTYELANTEGDTPFNWMIKQLTENGFRVIDVKWQIEWESGARPGGIWTFPVNQTYGSCYLSRYYALLVKFLARIVKRTKDSKKEKRSKHLLIAQGNCAGAAQIAFGLCYHGIDKHLDLVNLSSAMPPCPRYPLDKSSQVEEIPDDMKDALKGIENKTVAAAIANAINIAVGNVEKQVIRAEIDVDQFWCYLAIRGLEKQPRNATPIGELAPHTGLEWAREAEPILLGEPKLKFDKTEVHFFLAEHEGLPFIHEMTRLLHDRMQPQSKEEIERVDSGHKVYDFWEGVEAMVNKILRRAKLALVSHP